MCTVFKPKYFTRAIYVVMNYFRPQLFSISSVIPKMVFLCRMFTFPDRLYTYYRVHRFLLPKKWRPLHLASLQGNELMVA